MPIPLLLLIASLLLVLLTQGSVEARLLNHREAAPVKIVGRVVGGVRVEGRFKRPAPLKVYKNLDFCGAEVPNESLLVGPQGGVQNAVVVITGARRHRTGSPFKRLVLDNKNCAFVPHVQIAPVGSELLLLNNDPILHDVHARLGSETLFNVGLPTWRQAEKRLTRRGIISIECDVLHTWMSAYIVVTSSPYFAVTNEKGEFIIEGMPADTYEIEVWHEKLGRQLRKVVVVGERTSKVDLVFPCVFC